MSSVTCICRLLGVTRRTTIVITGVTDPRSCLYDTLRHVQTLEVFTKNLTYMTDYLAANSSFRHGPQRLIYECPCRS